MTFSMKQLPFSYAVRNLGRSPIRLFATVGGSVLVVGIILSAASYVQGMRRSLTVREDNNNVLLMGTGSEESLERSQISAGIPAHIRSGIRGIRERLDQAYVSPEVHMALLVSRGAEEEGLRALIRGITPAAFLVHSRVRIVDGRAPRSGHNELLIGTHVAARLGVSTDDLAIGNTLFFEGQEWNIVGHMNALGSVIDGEIWTGLTDLQVATRRDTLSCVVITLEDAEPADVEVWAATRLDLELSTLTEAEYYASLRRFYRPIQIIIIVTALLMSFAGILGALNTLYAAFAVRNREIGMLRAVGFSRPAIMLTLINESVIAAATGALIACGLSLLFLHGHAVRFTMGVFALHIDASVIAMGLVCGFVIGVIGAIPSSIRCLYMPIPEALKSK